MAGAILNLKPRAIRELHWHPNADEWQYYISGKAKLTVFLSHGKSVTAEFKAGDVGYVPQGCGHYIENISDESRAKYWLYSILVIIRKYHYRIG